MQTIRRVPRYVFSLKRGPARLNRKLFSHRVSTSEPCTGVKDNTPPEDRPRPEHAVISTFDLFSIGVGPSSSHTVGPMRAGKIFCVDLVDLGLLEKVKMIKISLYGSLAATGKGHHTPQAILLGLEGCDPETIDTGTIPSRYAAILENQTLLLGGKHRITYIMDRDMLWRWDRVLKTHPNGMRFSCFGEGGDLLATNEYFSVGGGFVVNEKTKTTENLYYKNVNKSEVDPARLSQMRGLTPSDQLEIEAPGKTKGTMGLPAQTQAPRPQPRYLFKSGDTLLAMTKRHNLTIAQLVYDNELHYLTHEEIHDKLAKIWRVMDDCIRTGVSTSETTLPGRLKLRRRAPMLYKRLMAGFYPGASLPVIGAGSYPGTSAITSPALDSSTDDAPLPSGSGPIYSSTSSRSPTNLRSARATRVVGSFDHPILPCHPRRTVFPAIDFLSCYAIAVNEVNASGGRIVTSPTNGAAGVIPAVLKYLLEFVSEEPEKTIQTFLLTAAAIGMLFKRGSTISAAEGCQAEVGVACAMAAGGFAACMGATPAVVLQAAEIGIEHNLGLTCDPIDGLVQVPCIERNSLGAVKAVTAAQLAMATGAVHSVSLDEAIEAMRLTAADMSVKYKETSLSGLATTVKIPLSSPAC